jgi:hypothetical protein
MTLTFAPERIETWPLERLKPYARNAKTHGADQVAKIAGSMAQFGWTVPVLVSGDGEVIAGQLAGPRRGADRGRARARPRRHAEGSGSPCPSPPRRALRGPARSRDDGIFAFDGAEALLRAWGGGLKPDPLFTVSEWADRY